MSESLSIEVPTSTSTGKYTLKIRDIGDSHRCHTKLDMTRSFSVSIPTARLICGGLNSNEFRTKKGFIFIFNPRTTPNFETKIKFK